MKLRDLMKSIADGDLDTAFAARCGISRDVMDRKPQRDSRLDLVMAARHTKMDRYRIRALRCALLFSQHYDPDSTREVSLLSVSGRSEISGNHTDHNRGRVIAAAVSLDVLAVAAPREDGVVRIFSEGFGEDTVSPEEIGQPNPADFFQSRAIIAGMERAFVDAGYKIGGFDAVTVSNVLKGSGLSSSAAFEVMVGNILNHLYNGGRVSNVEIAQMAQYAENVYFGKPCGLMDQTACAVGGLVAIDFADPARPVIEKLDFDLSGAGFALCITDTGGNHADLNEDYASVPAEMKSVAAALGQDVLRPLTKADIVKNIPALRESCGDRAVLRALHFVAENERVEKQCTALRAGDVDTFLALVKESGNSSYRYLQNVYTTKNVAEQGLSLALCLTESYLTDHVGDRCAWRVHGGGFAGTIQAFVPHDAADDYARFMEDVFGAGSVHVLQIRPEGAIRLA